MNEEEHWIEEDVSTRKQERRFAKCGLELNSTFGI